MSAVDVEGWGNGFCVRFSTTVGDGRHSTFNLATRYRFNVPKIETAPIQTGRRNHPGLYTMDTGLFPGVKQSGRGVNHPPHLAEFKKEYKYICTPTLGLHGLF
jgi:hypothetical protein